MAELPRSGPLVCTRAMEMLRALPYEGRIARRALSQCKRRPWRLAAVRRCAEMPQCRGSGQKLGGRISDSRPFQASSWKRYSASASGIYCSRAGTTETAEEGREIMVQHLLVEEDQLDLLKEIQARLVSENIEFSDLAAQYSICPSKKDGGMLGWVSRGRLVPEFEEAAFSAPLDKIVRVKTEFGWHLLQVTSERKAGFLVDIQAEELSKRMEDPEFKNKAQLLDVREPKEIEIASVDGFKPYPLSQFGKWGPTIKETLDPEKDTFVMCHHGVRSLQAAEWLKLQGFSRLYNVAGGIHAYSTRVDDTIPVY